MLAGLERYPPGLLLGVLTEVAARLPHLPPARLAQLEAAGRAALAPRAAHKRAWKAWARSQHVQRQDLPSAEVSCAIARLGGTVPAEPAAASRLLTLMRHEVACRTSGMS